jgi:hypothetical protein
MAENPESEAEFKIIPARKIFDKIQKGEPIEYENAAIEGDLCLYGAEELELISGGEFEIKHITSPITISNSIFNGSLNFLGIFKRPVVFVRSKFNMVVRFGGSKFSKGVDFSDSAFHRWADFSGCMFRGYADFKKTKFNEDVCFDGSEFNGYANFRDSEFIGNADFIKTKFSVYVDFRRAEFNQSPKFIGSKFSVCSNLENSEIKECLSKKKSMISASEDLPKLIGFRTRGAWTIIELQEFISSISNMYNGFLAFDTSLTNDLDFDRIFPNIERYVEENQLLKVHSIKMGSPGLVTLLGIPDILTKFLALWDYYSYERRRKEILLAKDCLELVMKCYKDLGGDKEGLIKVLCKEIKLLKDFESRGKLVSVTENLAYISTNNNQCCQPLKKT